MKQSFGAVETSGGHQCCLVRLTILHPPSDNIIDLLFTKCCNSRWHHWYYTALFRAGPGYLRLPRSMFTSASGAQNPYMSTSGGQTASVECSQLWSWLSPFCSEPTALSILWQLLFASNGCSWAGAEHGDCWRHLQLTVLAAHTADTHCHQWILFIL